MQYGNVKCSGVVSLKEEWRDMITALVCRIKLQREQSTSSVHDR